MRGDFAGESGTEASDHANPKSKANQDLAGDHGITNLILYLTPTGIVFNYLRNTQRLRIYQQDDLRKTFTKEVNILKTTGACSFHGSPFLLSLFHHKSQSKLNCKDLFFLKSQFFFFFNLFALTVIISNK